MPRHTVYKCRGICTITSRMLLICCLQRIWRSEASRTRTCTTQWIYLWIYQHVVVDDDRSKSFFVNNETNLLEKQLVPAIPAWFFQEDATASKGDHKYYMEFKLGIYLHSSHLLQQRVKRHIWNKPNGVWDRFARWVAHQSWWTYDSK